MAHHMARRALRLSNYIRNWFLMDLSECTAWMAIFGEEVLLRRELEIRNLLNLMKSLESKSLSDGFACFNHNLLLIAQF